jgi:hypothetical protein
VHGERPVAEAELGVNNAMPAKEFAVSPTIGLDAGTAGFAQAGVQQDLTIALQPFLLVSVFAGIARAWQIRNSRIISYG